MSLTRYPGPGKFEGELALAKVAYEETLDGCCEECGSVQELGWAGLVEGPLKPTPQQIEELGLTAEDIAYAEALAGCIVFEDSQGFVSVQFYEQRNAARLILDWERECKELEPEDEDGWGA